MGCAGKDGEVERMMERITFDGNFCDISQCRELPCQHGGNCSQKQVWERLKAYEDTGLTPGEVHSMSGEWRTMMSVLNSIGGGYGRLRELAEADKDGRLVVLPCNLCDRLYEVTGRKTISVYKVRAIRVGLFGSFIEWDIVEGFVWQSLSGINAGEIGKTVFLTREEAEKALEAMKDGNG
jgi:hypothetical protein